MSGIGTFLELSVPTDDIQASLEFYQRLGFTELTVNDIRTHYYAVVTDGRIAIGLHAGGFDEPALSFVVEGAAAARTQAGPTDRSKGLVKTTTPTSLIGNGDGNTPGTGTGGARIALRATGSC